MKIVVISDIHISSSRDLLFSREEALVKSINSQVEFSNEILFLIIGDIANKGKKEEFELFKSFLSRISAKLKLKIRFCVVPGNHDNHFGKFRGEKKREKQLNSLISKNLCTYENLIALPNVQQNYEEFASSVSQIDPSEIISSDIFCKSYLLEIEKTILQINCLNTAWSSRKKGVGREIIFPVDYPIDKFSKSAKADHCISIFHHPTNWMENDTNEYFNEHIKSVSDLIIIGHEHKEGVSYENDYIRKAQTIFYKSPPLQAKNFSLYSIIELDQQNNLHTVSIFKFSEGHYVFENEIDLNDYKAKTELVMKRGLFGLKTDFIRFLTDYGVDISHPHNANIYFESLFVEPQFKIKNEPIFIKTDLIRQTFVRDINYHNNMVIYGHADYGKTAFLKSCFSKLYSEGLLPVYIDFAQSKRINNETDLSKMIYRQYEQQYDVSSKSLIEEESNILKYLLFDNIDKYSHGIKNLLAILNGFFEKYNNWIITSADIFLFEPFISDAENKMFTHVFNEYELVEFGYESREKLIGKWVDLNPTIIDENDRIKKMSDFETVIDQLIVNKLLEPLPLFLVIIMQVHDSSISFNLDQSSKPHFYNYLILDAYKKLHLNTREINLFERFLADFAYTISKTNYEMTYSNFNVFHSYYVNKMKVSEKSPGIFFLERFIKGLVDVKILKKQNDAIKFKYNYHYCFYMSKYLVKEGNEGREETIDQLIETIDKELSANILNYCIYHSNNNEIFNLMMQKAKTIFSTLNEFRMEEDIKEFNEKYKELGPSDFDIKYIEDVDKSRIEIRKRQDEFNRKIEKVKAEEESLGESLDLVFRLNQSVRTMEVIGGILKNGLMDLDGIQKVDLGKESVSIGLRTSTGFLDSMSEDIIDIFEHYANELEASEFKSDQISLVRSSIYNMIRFAIYLILTKTADVIANSNDNIIFQEVFSEKTIAKQIMHLMIKIFYFQDLNISEIRQFIKNYRSNTLAIDCLVGLLSAYNNRYKIPLVQVRQINGILQQYELSSSKGLQNEFSATLNQPGKMIKD